MLPFIVGAVALGLLSRGSRDSNPNQLIIELDTALPAPEVEQVIGAIRVATPATVAQLDAMSNAYRQRGMPLTAYELARRAWDVRGRQGPPPQAPHPDAGAPQGLPPTSPPVGCLDAAANPAMCQAVTGALLTETNPDKLHAFAETLRAHFPQAAEALDSKAIVFGWTGPGGGSNGAHANGYANGYTTGHANGYAAPYDDASQADGAPAPQAPQTPQSWVQVASDMSNVPPQYHGSLATMMMQLGRDDSMAQGSERAVQVGNRMFVFVKPPAGPNVTAGTVWITRMSVGPSSRPLRPATTSGPALARRHHQRPDDAAVVGSWARRRLGSGDEHPVHPGARADDADAGPPRASGAAGVRERRAAADERPADDADPCRVVRWRWAARWTTGSRCRCRCPARRWRPRWPRCRLVRRSAMPACARSWGARREIVSSGQAGAEEMAKDAVFIEQQMQAEIEAQMHHAAMMEEAAMQQHAAAVQAAAAAEQAAQPPMPDRRAVERPRPSVYVKLKHSDSVWPVKLAKIGSGNKNNYDQLVAMNPHLVSPTGAWRQMFPGDEVCIPPEWAQNLRDRGFLIKSDFEGN